MNKYACARYALPSSGFTLIELMIAVIILGILAGIAYPNYRTYVTQSRRADAKIALTEIANRQEKFLLQCNQYTGSLGGDISACTGLNYATLSPDGHYSLSVALAASNSQFTATADPNGAGVSERQKNDGKLRIDQLGNKAWDKSNDNSWCCGWNDK